MTVSARFRQISTALNRSCRMEISRSLPDQTLYGSFAESQAPSSMAALTIRRTQCDCS